MQKKLHGYLFLFVNRNDVWILTLSLSPTLEECYKHPNFATFESLN